MTPDCPERPRVPRRVSRPSRPVSRAPRAPRSDSEFCSRYARRLQLPANIRERFVLPRHRPWCQVPFGMSGNSRGVEVRFLVTGGAPHRANAVTVVAALYRRLMRIAVSLRWTISIRMAVQATRMAEHPARFDEESRGTRRRIGDSGECRGGAKRAVFVSA